VAAGRLVAAVLKAHREPRAREAATSRAKINRQLIWTQDIHPHTTNASNTKQQIGSVLQAHREDASLSFISLRRMEGLIVLHDKGFLIMVSIR
jgi:hypothetical protein